MKISRVLAALLVSALPCALHAGEKTDAAVKELNAELAAVDKLVKQMAEPKPAKPKSNGWAEFHVWCEAAQAIKTDYDAGWYNALTDLESEYCPPPTPQDIKQALEITAKLPALAEKALPFDEIFKPQPANGEVETLEVMPVLTAFKYGVGRAVLLARSGRADEGRAELRVVARVLGKLQATQSNLTLMVYESVRSQVIQSGLMLPAGQWGWDAAFIREVLGCMPPPSARPSVLMGGELRFMAATIRTSYLKDADVLETLKKGEKERMKKAADADAEGAKILSEVRTIVKAMRTLVEADLAKPIDTSTQDGMKRALEFDAGLDKYQFIIWQPCLAGLRRSVLDAALELKLLEMEKGPLVKQKAAAERLVASRLAMKLTWEGEIAIVALDEKHELVSSKRVHTSEVRVKPVKR